MKDSKQAQTPYWRPVETSCDRCDRLAVERRHWPKTGSSPEQMQYRCTNCGFEYYEDL